MGEHVSAGGLEGLRGGVGDGHGVGSCRLTVCCLRCFCNESFSLWQKGSSGGRHRTSSMPEGLTDWATVCGRMSLIPRCRPSFKLSEITSTGRLGAGSTSRSSSSSSSRIILSSISCSFLCAASISMQELSISGRGRTEGGCGKVRLWCAEHGCRGGTTTCCADRGGELFSKIPASVSGINLRFLGLQPSSSSLLCLRRRLVAQLLSEFMSL